MKQDLGVTGKDLLKAEEHLDSMTLERTVKVSPGDSPMAGKALTPRSSSRSWISMSTTRTSPRPSSNVSTSSCATRTRSWRARTSMRRLSTR